MNILGEQMKIALIGYGNMGKVIQKIAESKGIEVVSIIDPNVSDSTYKEINEESLKDVDVAIDFSRPTAVVESIKKVAELGKNLVVGTTGWYDQMEDVKDIVSKSGIGFIWSGNFSLGVNIYFRILKNASKIINNFDDYDIFVHEFHHRGKADSPSGTATMIGDILLNEIDRKKRIVTEELKRKIEDDEVHISSTRGGSIPGTHVVGFDSLADTIELKHTARGREGFALGAVMAAKWIHGKKGFFNIDDFMKEIIMG